MSAIGNTPVIETPAAEVLPLEWATNPWSDQPLRAGLGAVLALAGCVLVLSLREPAVVSIGLCIAVAAAFVLGVLLGRRIRADRTLAGGAAGGPCVALSSASVRASMALFTAVMATSRCSSALSGSPILSISAMLRRASRSASAAFSRRFAQRMNCALVTVSSSRSRGLGG